MKRITGKVYIALLCGLLPLGMVSGCSSGTDNKPVVSAPSFMNSQEKSVTPDSSVTDSFVTEPSDVSTTEDFEYKNTYYYEDDDIGKSVECVELVKYIGSSAKVTIPEKIGELPVEILDSSLFEDTAVEEVVIPKVYKSMSYNCFANCAKLTSVTLPSELKTIESGTFKNCTALTEIVLPEGLESIESSAFAGCSALTNINLPESVKKIDSYAFQDCIELKNFMFPSQLNYLGSDVLYNTGILNESPVGEVYIGNVFYCYKFDNSSRDAAQKSVIELSKKGKYTFKDGTRIIGSPAFCNNESKDGVSAMDIEVPDSVVFIGSGAFNGMVLNTVNINAQVAKNSNTLCFSSDINQIVFDDDVTELAERLLSNIHMDRLEIPGHIKTIGDSAFSVCDIKSAFVHEGVETIGSGAFVNNSSLEKVYLPSTIKEIKEPEQNIFDQCPNVTVYTTAGSYAEQYAKSIGVNIKIIKDESEFPF